MAKKITIELTPKQAEQAARFLRLIECSVATRDDSGDRETVAVDNAEIDGFNVLAKALGETPIKGRIKYRKGGRSSVGFWDHD
jgi:hypothetical protein